MFGQPRCREWTPLATQQLRLRSLLQIVGYNLYGNDERNTPGSLYYTLHVTAMSAPFYTSEKLISNHPKWREIDSEYIHRMSSQSVVVRVWKHIYHEDTQETDKIIQTWSVYFSGLLHIGANLSLDFSAKSFQRDTLIFQMTGGYFCPYDKLRVHPKGKFLQNDSRNRSPSKVIPIKELKADSRFISKSHSPPNNAHLRQNVGRIYPDSYRERFQDEKHETCFEIKEYSGSEGSGEVTNSLSASNRDLANIDESETAENFDANTPLFRKFRYATMKFLNSEIRPSYNADKLRNLHLLQFSIKLKLQAVQEIRQKIYKKFAMKNCESLQREFVFVPVKQHQKKLTLIDESEVQFKDELNERFKEETSKAAERKVSSKTHGGRRSLIENTTATDCRFTLRLDKLLQLKMQPSPSQRSKYDFLTKRLEISRFKKRLLIDERDSALVRIRRLKEKHAKIFEDNQDNGSDLMQKYHSLSKKWDQLKELRKSEAALRELSNRSASLLKSRRWQLVQDIPNIFPIIEDEKGKLYILGVHLPACQGAGDGLKQISESDLAVALGRVAHASALAAALLSVPLRHPLKLMGSRTKILDHLATQQNEIPLFARSKDSMMFRYGLFLLNRNISQLLWATHRFITPDPKDTLTNLRRLLTPPAPIPNLDMSNMFGSLSSMENESVPITGVFNPIQSTFSLPVDSTSSNQQSSLISPNSVNLIRKVPHHSLRSLVAIGTDRSTKSIISGGFHNTGNRQFNRFKDSVDGHSPKAAMVIRKHRYSRSVGSYIEEQALEMNASAVGSEPSLLLHENQLSDHSESPSENVENVLSFSESDLTKVSDITSPGSVSCVNEFSNPGKVLFSIGDDDNTRDSLKYDKNCKFPTLSKENVEIQNLQLDVNQLSKELEQLCVNCSSDKANCCNSRIIDIEKLDNIVYCNEPCSVECQNRFEALKHCNNLGDSDEVAHDEVIVLPSAEAIMTSSSHFTESLRLDDTKIQFPELYCKCTEEEKCSKCTKRDSVETTDDNVSCEINDSVLIDEGNSASQDANELLKTLKLMDEEISQSVMCDILDSTELPIKDVENNGSSEAMNVVTEIR